VDENYALAWAGAADCHSWRCMWYEGSADNQRLADECSRKALELAPELAEAYASRSHAMSASGRYAEAETAFKKAIELDPQLYEAYYYAGRAYFAQGKYQEAVESFAQAAAIRPDDPTSRSLKSTALRALGSDEADVAAQESIVVTERYLALNPDDALAWSRLSGNLMDVGRAEESLKCAERAYELSPDFCRYNVACAYVRAGRVEPALDLLEEHARNGAVLKDWLAKDSDWNAVREHPRFKAIERIVESADERRNS
jgi:adenylate cyclase